MKRIILPFLTALVFFACSEEEFNVESTQTNEADSVTMIFNNIPREYRGDSLYVFSLNNQDEFFSAQITTATEDGELLVSVPGGRSSFSLIAYIPTIDDWSVEDAFDAGLYSSITGINVRNTTYITDNWESASSYDNSSNSGAAKALSVTIELNNSDNEAQEFDQGNIINIFADVSNNLLESVQSVSFSVDGSAVQDINEEPYEINFNTIDLAVGEHTASVTVMNENNLTVSDEISFIILTDQNTAPEVDITGISNDFTIDRQTVRTIASNVSDDDGFDDIEKVEFIINGSLEATITEAPFNFEWDSYDNQVGEVTIEVKAYDQAGATRSDFVNGTLVEPENYWPRVNITSPSNGSTITAGDLITISTNPTDVEGDPINYVNFYLDNSNIGTDNTDPYELVDYNTAGLQAGEYTLRVRVYDNSFNFSEDEITITIVE